MIWRVFLRLIMATAVALGVVWCARGVFGQEHTHEGAVGKFYETWRAPAQRHLAHREVGCCNNLDCRPVLELRKRRGDGLTEVLVQMAPAFPPAWYPVPAGIWEDNQEDPRESPDGRAHVCIRSGQVVCAVRASDG